MNKRKINKNETVLYNEFLKKLFFEKKHGQKSKPLKLFVYINSRLERN